MDEEVVLLVEDGVAVLIDDPNAHLQPPAHQASNWNKSNMQDIPLQSPSVAKQSIGQKHILSEAALAKRLARQQKRQDESPRDESLFNPDQSRPTGKAEKEVVEVENRFPITRPSSAFPWYHPDDHTFSTLDDAAKSGIWTYPSTSLQRAKCAVFRHLWSQGNFLGTGIKFGGDFLVYPGDPLRYHSHFVATVHFKSDVLRPMEIVAHGRLGTGTRKNHLICSYDEKTGEVECFSIEWAGFG
jgi:tRNA-splicing endonuclease subunit Sen34